MKFLWLGASFEVSFGQSVMGNMNMFVFLGGFEARTEKTKMSLGKGIVWLAGNPAHTKVWQVGRP